MPKIAASQGIDPEPMKESMKEPFFDKKENTGIRHLVNATRFSFAGVKSAFQRESAFRQELFVFAVILPSGAWFASSWGLVVALISACLLVLAVELLNSAIEAAIDRSGTEHHELAELAKDYGSAAVMMTLGIAGLTWLYIVISGIAS